MAHAKNHGFLHYLFRAPVYLFRWQLGWLFGKRFLLLTHIGRKSGLHRQTVLEVVEYREQGPEVVVVSGFGFGSEWLRNIEARGNEEVKIGSRHFAAKHRLLDEDEAVLVLKNYEHRNQLFRPIIRIVLSHLVGWRYCGTEDDRRRLVKQLPFIAFRQRTSALKAAS